MGPHDTHFEPGIIKAAVNGAWIGTISVMVMFTVAILLTDASMDLMAVAALAAVFGGSAFGAMLGASTAASRQPIPIPVEADERGYPQ